MRTSVKRCYMHRDADPDVTVLCFRHPHTVANAQQTISNKATQVHPIGEAQIEHMIATALAEGATHFVTSMADRTWGPAFLAVLSELGRSGVSLSSSPLFNEWEKPVALHGRGRDEPHLREYLQKRIRNFGPDYVPVYEGEETYKDSVNIVKEALLYFSKLGETHKVIAHFGHRNRTMMLKTRAVWGSLHPDLFKKYYYNSGFDNGAMFRIWYGLKFAPETGLAPEWDWCTDEGGNTHIPPPLRTS
ncbi:MAG: hypothetical protein JWL82_352 [Parcubacteria group bacterium]|nr:hypothetical protein [Parcubacteria group bacterium]